MNGPQHYQMAERLLADAAFETFNDGDLPQYDPTRIEQVQAAQVHATLALAAATALADNDRMPVWDADAWEITAGTMPEQPAGTDAP